MEVFHFYHRLLTAQCLMVFQINYPVLEVYGGAGFGNAYYSDNSPAESLTGKYILPFAQVNLGS